MAQLLPNADLYALTLNPATTFRLGGRQVKTTFIDKLRPIRGRHDLQLPLMPLAWRYASRRHYEMVVTSSHACVKGFWPARKALHLCYCYTPMRYVWLSSVDARGRPSPSRAMAEAGLRSWDLRSAKWVDEFAAISTEVQRRIETIYSRFSRVIHPPVATDFFTPGDGAREDFVLAVGRMVPYKRLDLAIRACNAADCRLVIAGFGPEEQSLRALADRLEAHVDFVTAPEDEQLRAFYRTARAVLFPAHEDFGLVPVEAQACGTPVLALGRGGSVDTVVDGVTGILVEDHTEDQWISGLHTLLESQFDPLACRRNALRFSRERFSNEFSAWLSDAARSRGVEPPYLDSPVIR